MLDSSPLWTRTAEILNLALAYLALRHLWSSQHKLDLKASIVRWGALVLGVIAIYGSFHWYRSTLLFTIGLVVCLLFFLFPDIPFYLARTIDRKEDEHEASRR